MNLPLRILLGYFLVVGLAAFFVLRIFVNEVRPSVRETIEETMVDAANLLAVMATDELKAGRIKDGAFARQLDEYRRREIDAPIWHFRKQSLDFRVLVTDDKGIVLLDSDHQAEGLDHSRWNDVYKTLLGEYGARSTRLDEADDKSNVFHVAAPIRDGARIIGVLTVAKPVATVEPIIERSEQTILRHGIVLMGGAALIGLGVTLWLTASIRRLRAYARDVAAGKRVTPPTGGGRELSELANAMETMRSELDGKQYVEHYVQALTHELKSPLAALRGAGEILAEPGLPEAERSRFAAHVLEQGARMQATIERMLALSQLEARRSLEHAQALDFGALVTEMIATRRGRAEAASLRFERGGFPAIALHGERDRLALAIGNLLDNALDHASAGSAIEIDLQQGDGQAVLRIHNTGPAIPDYALPRLFERFYGLSRPDGSKGSGLGLAIVQEIAVLHGGGVSLANRPDGGVSAELRLPC
ncbi:two-component system sensor histidine kinase CreC [Uliginosibacterium sp. H1]|uniref:two-component system sensor histidine kinase CreC n=1 Tax=Uliginosibacterium sp. H1 TaxID=3114757 RepID=UPI002E1847EB|nr:two-component system sensor histidine kinase CreC [Uliginosibacterium sp. H1]